MPALTVSQLEGLSAVALVALAARAARRVLPLFVERSHSHNLTAQVQTLDAAIVAAESFCNGVRQQPHVQGGDYAAKIDYFVKDQMASEIALSAAFAAAAAAHATTDFRQCVFDVAKCLAGAQSASPDSALASAIVDDFALLSTLSVGDAQDIETIDPSEGGPLGLLWRGNEPDWYADSYSQLHFLLMAHAGNPLVTVTFDDSRISREEMVLFLQYVSEVYRSGGGSGLSINSGRSLVPAWEAVS